jgi:hypothetical protein
MSEKNLLDPANNDLIPGGGPTIEPPELSPDYAERHPPEALELSPGYIERIPKRTRPETADGAPAPQASLRLRNLMNPQTNELIPEDGFVPVPGVDPESPKLVKMETPDLMSFLTKAAEGGHGCERIAVDLGGGLKASSCPSGGLSIFKDGVQVHSIDGLSAEN